MLMLAGIVLLVLGLGSGAILLVAPFGLLPAAPAGALWLLFPAFVGVGYVLFVIPASPPRIRLISRLASAALLLLATLAAVAIFLISAALLTPDSATGSLWYVLGLGTLLGALGLMSGKPPAD